MRIQVYYQGGGTVRAEEINVLRAFVTAPDDIIKVGSGPGQVTVHVVPADGITPITKTVTGYVSPDPLAPAPAILTTFTADDTTGLAFSGVFSIATEGTYYYTVVISDGQDALTDSVVVDKAAVSTTPFTLAITKPVATTPPKLGQATGKITVEITVTGGITADVAVVLTPPDSPTPVTHTATSPDGRHYTAIFDKLGAGVYPLRAYITNSATTVQDTATADILPPDLEIGDQLTFLPWVQSELAAAASTGANGRPELTLSAQLRTSTATDKNKKVESEVAVGPAARAQIYGAGDVLGVNLRAILGTTPVPGARGTSALELAAIEFQEEDLPWRYSTRRATDTNSTPAPWLFLLVLKADEYARQVQGSDPLPSIKVLKANLYPDPDARQQAQWAHVQLNASLGDAPAPTATTALPPETKDINDFLLHTLPAHPALAYSRVLCPRRLEADTAYRAFLLPATEAGRLVGLGFPFDPSHASEASFPTKATAPDTFPIYFE